MKSRELKQLSLSTLEEKRAKAKTVLSTGIGAGIAYLMVCIIAAFMTRGFDNEVKFQILFPTFSGLLVFVYTIFALRRNLENIREELNSRKTNNNSIYQLANDK